MLAWIMFLLCALFVLTIILPAYAGRKPGDRPVPMAAVKALGTLIAAALALYGAVRLPEPASRTIAAAILVCALADVVLLLHFLAGTGLFLVGHLLLVAAFLQLAPLQPASFVVFPLLYGVVIVLFFPGTKGKRGKLIPYLLYGGVLLFMLSVAVLLPVRLGLRGFAAACGALLFAASDLLIARANLKPPLKHQSFAVMGLYYAAQLLLSLVSLQPCTAKALTLTEQNDL